MIRFIACLFMAFSIVGCSSGGDASDSVRTPIDQTLFGPSAMRVLPGFSQVHDWTGDGVPDGIEAVIELQDQFGDQTKASGRIIFELYEYRPYNPDPRGARVVAPWEGRLDSIEDQRARWSRASRAYIFQLALDSVRTDQPYVLTAMFELSGGGRFFDRLILEPDKSTPPIPTPPTITVPTPSPSTRDQTPAPTTAHTPPPRADQP